VNSPVPFSDKNRVLTADTYLRSLNIFVAHSNNHFKPIVPDFVTATLKENDGIFFETMIQLKPNAINLAQDFEWIIPELAIKYQNVYQRFTEEPVWFSVLLPKVTAQTWKGLDFESPRSLKLWESGPVVSKNGNLSEEEIEQVVKQEGAKQLTKDLKMERLGSFLDKLVLGTVVVMGEKSSTADVIVKAKGKHVIEFQTKSGRTPLSKDQIEAELKKSVVDISPDSGYSSYFILITTAVTTDNFDPNFLDVPKGMKCHLVTPEQLEKHLGPTLTRRFSS
jgi:hypothetical protein